MYHLSAQGVDKQMINVQYYYNYNYYIIIIIKRKESRSG